MRMEMKIKVAMEWEIGNKYPPELNRETVDRCIHERIFQRNPIFMLILKYGRKWLSLRNDSSRAEQNEERDMQKGRRPKANAIFRE